MRGHVTGAPEGETADEQPGLDPASVGHCDRAASNRTTVVAAHLVFFPPTCPGRNE